MKKKLVFFLVIFFLVTGLFSTNVFAKKKNERKPYAQKISYKIKGSTLTISKGKKKVSKIKGIEKVKKIVVKKQVISLPTEYFEKCKKLKELNVTPELYFLKTKVSKKGKKDSNLWNFPVKVEKVRFTSSIHSIKCIESYRTEKYEVYKKDKNYFSKDGLIYKKRYWSIYLAGVPSEIKNVCIMDKTTAIDYYALTYISTTNQSKNRLTEPSCNKIKEIVIPQSVSELEGYTDKLPNKNIQKANLVVKTRDVYFLAWLMKVLNYDFDLFAKAFINSAKWENDFLIIDDYLLVAYRGNNKEVSLPDKFLAIIGDNPFPFTKY